MKKRKFSFQRALILSTIKDNEPISISNLAKKINSSAGTTIYRYLEELEEYGLIKMKKENKKRGKPTMLSTTDKAKPLSQEEKEILSGIKDMLGRFNNLQKKK